MALPRITQGQVDNGPRRATHVPHGMNATLCICLGMCAVSKLHERAVQCSRRAASIAGKLSASLDADMMSHALSAAACCFFRFYSCPWLSSHQSRDNGTVLQVSVVVASGVGGRIESGK